MDILSRAASSVGNSINSLGKWTENQFYQGESTLGNAEITNGKVALAASQNIVDSYDSSPAAQNIIQDAGECASGAAAGIPMGELTGVVMGAVVGGPIGAAAGAPTGAAIGAVAGCIGGIAGASIITPQAETTASDLTFAAEAPAAEAMPLP